MSAPKWANFRVSGSDERRRYTRYFADAKLAAAFRRTLGACTVERLKPVPLGALETIPMSLFIDHAVKP